MDPRDIAKGNGVYLCVEPVVIYTNFVGDTNWGVPTIPRLITLDPTAHAEPQQPQDVPRPGWELMPRGARRKLLADLSDEFASLYGDLLRELAR